MSFDSFTLVLEPDDSEDEVIHDVDMREGFTLCPEKSALKNKRKQNVDSKGGGLDLAPEGVEL